MIELKRAAEKAFAISLAGIGVLQLIFQQVLIGRPRQLITNPVGETILGSLVGLALIACAVQAWRMTRSTVLFLACGIFIFAWPGFSNLYVVLVNGDTGSPLTAFGKAITFGSAILALLYTTSPAIEQTRWIWAPHLLRYCLGFFLLACGIQHFLYVEFVKFLVPAWIPFPVFWTYFSGVALALSGTSLITTIKYQPVAMVAGLMIFTWLLVLHIPRAVADTSANETTAVCEALGVSALLVTLAKLKIDN